MDLFLLYLVLRLDSVHLAVGVLMFLSVLVFAASSIVFMCAYEEHREIAERAGRYVKNSVTGFILLFVINVILPNTTQAIVLYGADAALNFSRSDGGKQVGDKVMMLLNAELDKLIEKRKVK